MELGCLHVHTWGWRWVQSSNPVFQSSSPILCLYTPCCRSVVSSQTVLAKVTSTIDQSSCWWNNENSWGIALVEWLDNWLYADNWLAIHCKLWCTHVHPLLHVQAIMHDSITCISYNTIVQYYCCTFNRWTMLPSLITMATSWVATTLWRCTIAESNTGTMTLQVKMARYYIYVLVCSDCCKVC